MRITAESSFRASPRSIKPIYTGGPVILTQDGQWLISTLGEEVQVTEVETGLPVARVRGVSYSPCSADLRTQQQSLH
jgi:U3 small nucleolar RNA-associated protein 13